MKTLDDNAVAYGFYMAIVAVIFFGFAFAIFSPVINHLITAQNGFVAEGGVSVATNNSVNWCVGGFIVSMIAALGGVLYWAIIRVQEQKVYGQS